MTVDLTRFLAPNLVLKWHDREFHVLPPSRDDGIILTALQIAGAGGYLSAQGEDAPPLDPKYSTALELAKDRELGEISLGPAYAEMLEAGVSGPDIDMYALYALFHWTLGEEAAGQIIAAMHSGGEEAPKGRKPRRNTPSTE